MIDLEVHVSVVKYTDRANLILRYVDPRTGSRVTRSAGTSNRREAERAAAQWEVELRSGSYQKPVHTSWADFRERYEKQISVEQADSTLKKVIAVFNAVEQAVAPRRVADLDDQRLVRLKQELIQTRTINTVAGYLAHIRSALSTAIEWGILVKLPRFPKLRRGKGAKLMRGRSVTPEEFQAMIRAVPSIVGTDAAPSWQFLLRGFWTSGLRLGDAYDLFWDGLRGHCVDLSGSRPLFVIRGALEKGKRDRRLPMAPEFAELLLTVPEPERRGRVFKPQARRPGHGVPEKHRVGEVISQVGAAAGVCVDADPATGEPIKFASAHDLRRSFGERWAKRVMSAVLQTLMRHASIQTTMQYYVSLEAEATADVLWQAFGNTFGNSAPHEGI